MVMLASNMVTASRTTACNQDTNRAMELHRIVTQEHSQATEGILLPVTVATTDSTLTAAVEATIVEVAILQDSKCINNMRHSTRRSSTPATHEPSCDDVGEAAGALA